MATVCIATSQATAYDSLTGILHLVSAEFTALGHTVMPLPLEKANEWLPVVRAMSERRDPIFVVGMSGLGMDFRFQDQRLMWDALGIPFFTWYCDHPSYFITRHRLESRFLCQSYVFPDHAIFNRDYLQTNGSACAVHIGMPSPGAFPAAAPGDTQDRILFSKSGWDPAALEASLRQILSPRNFRLQFEIIDAAIGGGCMALPEAVMTVAEAYSLYLTPGGDIFNGFLTRADNYIRAVKTTAVASVLIHHPVDFYGTGWGYLQPQATQARFFGAVPFNRIREILSGYLGAASINPNVDLSLHDRTFFALSAGVVPLYDHCTFSRTHMPLLDPYGFRFTPGSIQAAVEALYHNPAEARERAALTRQTMTPKFSMQASALEIADICLDIHRGPASGGHGTPSPAGDWRAQVVAP